MTTEAEIVAVVAEPDARIEAENEAAEIHADARVEIAEAEADAAVEIAAAQTEAVVAVAEAEAAATVAVAALTLEQTTERLMACETQISELKAMVTTMMGAVETQQATIALLIPPALAESSEQTLAETEATALPPAESVVVDHPAARVRRAGRRLI